jgi:hypothetical protein
MAKLKSKHQTTLWKSADGGKILEDTYLMARFSCKVLPLTPSHTQHSSMAEVLGLPLIFSCSCPTSLSPSTVSLMEMCSRLDNSRQSSSKSKPPLRHLRLRLSSREQIVQSCEHLPNLLSQLSLPRSRMAANQAQVLVQLFWLFLDSNVAATPRQPAASLTWQQVTAAQSQRERNDSSKNLSFYLKRDLILL